MNPFAPMESLAPSLSMKTHVAQEGEPVLVAPQEKIEVLNAGLLRTFVPPVQAPSQALARRIGAREVKYSFWLLNGHHRHVSILTGQFAKGIPTTPVAAVAV
jgi:hypothetical protein